MAEITQALRGIANECPEAARELLPLVYDELRRLAVHKMSGEKPGQTLQATALVHDAYLRLTKTEGEMRWESRRHFFAAAADAMRLILIDKARSKGRLKKGGELNRVELTDVAIEFAFPDIELLELDKALLKLAAEHAAAAEVVRLRFFVGLSHEETAEILNTSAVTVKRTWRFARAWLHREMCGSSENSESHEKP